MAAALIGATLLAAALLTAACGGSSQVGGTGASGPGVQQALAFAACMRSHGAPDFPDPNSDGVFIATPQNHAEFNAPASTRQACSYLRPGKPELSPAMRAQANRANLAFAACMRRHGILKFPDDWGGGINVGRMQSLGIDANSPQFSAALKACGFGRGEP